MTLTVLRAIEVFCRMPLIGNVWCFSHGWTGVTDMWEWGGPQKWGALLSTSCLGHMPWVWLFTDVDYDSVAEVVSVRCLLYKASLFPFLCCPLWKEVTIYSPQVRVESPIPPSSRVLHLYRLIFFCLGNLSLFPLNDFLFVFDIFCIIEH